MQRDRLWFYTSPREWVQSTKTPWLHDGLLGPVGEPVVNRALHRAWTNRLTWQLDNANKLAGTYEWLQKTNFTSGLSGSVRPEATNIYGHRPFFYVLSKWTSVVRNRVFVEAGYSLSYKDYYMNPQPGISPSAPAKQDVGRGITFGNTSRYIDHWQRHDFLSASVTYVTGSHSLKAGVQWDDGYDRVENYSSNGSLTQVYRNGVPFSVNVYDFPSVTQADVKNWGLYVQDSWTLKRLTLNPGVRWDQFVGSLPELSMPAGRFVPARRFAAIDDLPNWKHVSPRFGASFDLSGKGKTALKGSVGKYMIQYGSGLVFQYNPSNSASVVTPDPRDWTDLNRDDIAQDNEIGPSRNPAWGVQPNRRPEQDRAYDILSNVSLDHELVAGLGVSVAYNRRDTKNISWADNLTNVAEDWQRLTVADPRGNGQLIDVYQILPGRVGPANTVDLTSENTRSWDGVDVTVRGRLRGANLTAGTSTGRTKERTCQVENPNSLRFCEQETPYLTNFKLSGTYPLPWWGFRASVVYQSLPGIESVINHVVTRAQLPQLVTASSVTVRLNQRGQEYLPRFNQVDLSFAGSIRVHRFRVKPQIDFFNMFNTNAVNSQTTTYPSHGRVTAILPGRIIRVGTQLDF
ncbi:MAG: TonB-dependent receptor [Acidimicrobiia bacterium]|nr:TonB-dependent receptor [Acidimicrobiia bacterium]